MKLERTKNASRSIFFGIILKIYQMLIPFFMRTAMIYLMGVEYLGLGGLFSSILQVLNLAELGVGSAMVYSMYKPIAQDDTKAICALEKLYRTYYRIIGLVIAIVGCILTPFIPRLISGNIPNEINIYVLYLLHLSATVMSYLLFAYKNSLFIAHQRNDITSRVTLVTSTLQYVIQILVLWLFHNYYLYIVTLLCTQIINNILVAVLADKIYLNYKPQGDLPKEKVREINKSIRDLFTAKLGATIVNSADTIVISAFLGLTVLAIYQNYYFIMSSVMGIMAIVFNSFLAGIGNSMVTESIDKNYNDFKKIVFIVNWISVICVACFACVYQPFITLWVGKQYTFNYGVVVFLCIYFYLLIMQQIIGLYKDAAGIWHEDRFRPLVSAIANLTMNILFVKLLGIYAILLSTILSYLIIAMPWMISNVFKYVFKRDYKEYFCLLGRNIIICTIVTFGCYFACRLIRVNINMLEIIKNILVCFVIGDIILWLFYKNNQYYNDMIDYANQFTKYKFDNIISSWKR